MSSMQRGATGAGRPKPVNVNTLYSGRNLAAGNKPIGKHGLQSVGKSVGVVRRMPPPATLPSLKAENNGQDPTINIVPQSGTGWNKNESTPAPAPQEPAKPIITASATGPDLRPTWAKPPTAEPAPVNGSASAQPSNREFPTLAVSAQGKEGKPQNAWNTNALNMPQDGRSTSISSSYEDDRQLPSRYYDNASSKTGYRSRFQGSNDARASQPNYYSGGRVSESRDSERERGESMSESVSGRSESGRPTADSQASRRTTSESFFDKSEPAMVEAVPPSESIQKEQYSTATDIDREAAIERSRQKRMNYKSGPYDERSDAPAETYQKPAGHYNGHHQREQGGYQQQQQPRRWVQPQQPAAPPAPQPEYRLLKRPERIELEDISDEEEEIQMTKLNKPAVRVMKRVANGQDNSTENQEPPAKEPTAQPTCQKTERRVQSGETRRPQPEQAKRGDRPKTDENRQPAKVNKVHNGGTDNRSGGGEKKAPIEEVSSAPPPSAENVWAKRQEERESQEKDHKNSMPKVMKQVIEQHFPDVKEAASMKVDKDQARQPADADFTRAALRARRAAASNDVRKMMGNDEERRPHHQQSRQDRNYLDNERGGPPQRYQNNPRNQRGNREYNRDYNRDRDYDRQPQREYNNEEEPRYQQDRNYREEGGNWERNHNRHNNDYSEEYYGGPREYTNSKVAGMRRGGRGIRGGFGRGRGRIAYSTGHAHSQPQPQYQIQRRPKETEKQPEERGEKENEQKEKEEEKVNLSVKVEDDSPVSKSQNIQQAAGDSATENTEASKPLSGAGDSEPTESTEMPATAFEYKNDRQTKMNSRGGRWANRGSAPRGRGETRRGRGTYQGAQEYRPRRVQHVPEEDVDENGKLPEESEFTGPSRGRGRYSQQRVHRGQPRERGSYNKHARSNANSHRSQPTGDFGAQDYRLKSPVASSEGHDEWETASESSGRIRHAGAGTEKESSPPKRVQQQPRRQPPRVNSDAARADAPHASERIRSKNGQPARRTCRSPSDVGSNRKQQQQQQEGEQQQQRKNSAEKSSSSSSSNNGLAGLDMNNYAGVVVIDDHLQETVSAEAVDEFEEVLNKKAKRAKALELQQKQEAEEKKRVKEAERVQRMQAKKAQRQNNKKEGRKFEEAKRKESNDSSAKAASNATEPASDKPRAALTRKDIPVTTVWNSAHVAAMEQEGKEPDNGQGTAAVIPSPIARPTPRSKSSASDTANAPKEEAQRALELPVTLSSSQPLRGDKYDFTFDPHIHEAQVRESQEKTAVISTANSESGSVAEDYRLKEKLNKVKDLWQGELEKESPQPSLPSNVAKVKPQPQGGEPPAGDIAKTDAAVTAATSPQQNNGGAPQRSPAPAITPFSSSGFGGIGFPSSYNTMPLSEMGQPARSFVAGSVMVPPNATSPPVSIPMGMSFVPQQQRGQANFVENPMYMQQHQQNMTWAPPTAPLEIPFGTSMSMQQPHQAGGGSQFAFAAGSRNVVHPQQMQQSRGGGFQPGGNGGLLTTHQAAHGQKMGGAGPHPPPMVPFGHPHHHHPHHRPMDMMNGGINMPPPPPQNMQGPPMQMGNAHQQQQPRGDRGQFNSMMGGGGPFNPSPQPPPHFNQPPPNMNMRFSQPPPPMNEMGWSKGGGGNQQSRQHFGTGPRNQGNPGNRGGFSNYPTDVWSGMQQFVPNQFQQNNNSRMQHSGGKGAGNPIDHSNELKRPSSGGSPQNAGTTA